MKARIRMEQGVIVVDIFRDTGRKVGEHWMFGHDELQVLEHLRNGRYEIVEEIDNDRM